MCAASLDATSRSESAGVHLRREAQRAGCFLFCFDTQLPRLGSLTPRHFRAINLNRRMSYS
jgi:hypothetical protein